MHKNFLKIPHCFHPGLSSSSFISATLSASNLNRSVLLQKPLFMLSSHADHCSRIHPYLMVPAGWLFKWHISTTVAVDPLPWNLVQISTVLRLVSCVDPLTFPLVNLGLALCCISAMSISQEKWYRHMFPSEWIVCDLLTFHLVPSWCQFVFFFF